MLPFSFSPSLKACFLIQPLTFPAETGDGYYFFLTTLLEDPLVLVEVVLVGATLDLVGVMDRDVILEVVPDLFTVRLVPTEGLREDRPLLNWSFRI
jgi:hypothetical protein